MAWSFLPSHSYLSSSKTSSLPQIVQSILLHGSESQAYSPAPITRFDSLHYKALRQIFQIKSPYYHRVVNPSDAPCSNESLLSLAYPVLPTLYPPSTKISDRRIQYLGHMLRHPDSPESLICSNPSRTLRPISSSFRRGAPRARWPELSLAEAHNKPRLYRTSPPNPGAFLHLLYPLYHSGIKILFFY